MANELRLRALEKDDLIFLHKLFNNPDVMNYWFSESYMSMEQLKESYDKDKDNPRNREFILTNDDEPLGFVALYEIEQRHRNAEFAIIIDPAHQGNGYAGTATKLAADYAFSVLNLHKLYLIVAKANKKGRHVYEKVGFRAEGDMVEHFFINGEYHDGVMMHLFQRDYWKMK
ncbi:GNAT family N-acetyltransferase [Lentibacillus salicampi]|uniref:GNAT family N-acetyltransferase n=1 Tax=Lentibacillus salicampi TaxID=175306 RepID=A0A4Y9AGF3_9BACI|nr:GNAT family N-acetyltransferase [Lentibacillus salicampi]TFJ94167.1 GNAT family N-acetyltransferase [Lentibacillus salicampi]